MYRDDQEAARQRAEAATREAERLRVENQQMRYAMVQQQPMMPMYAAMPPAFVYQNLDVRMLPLPERARLAQHQLKPFPVAAVAILNIITLGLFGLIHFGLMHDRLPRAAANDPSSGKAIGFAFIPYYNFYWVFFSGLRLTDRLSLQLQLRGLPDRGPRGMVMAACIFSVIPYVNFLIGFPIIWTIAACMLQSTVNKVAALPPNSWDPTTYPGYPQ
jgi:hypothetical protein